MSRAFSLHSLPNELLQNISSYLTYSEQLAFKYTNSRCYRAVPLAPWHGISLGLYYDFPEDTAEYLNPSTAVDELRRLELCIIERWELFADQYLCYSCVPPRLRYREHFDPSMIEGKQSKASGLTLNKEFKIASPASAKDLYLTLQKYIMEYMRSIKRFRGITARRPQWTHPELRVCNWDKIVLSVISPAQTRKCRVCTVKD